MSIGDDVRRTVRRAAAEAINQAAFDLLGEAQREAPVDEGTLRASGRVDPATDATLTAEVSFNTPYAAAQHEGHALQHRGDRVVDWRVRNHPKGGKVKYLEDPLKAMTVRYQRHIADQVRQAVERTGR